MTKNKKNNKNKNNKPKKVKAKKSGSKPKRQVPPGVVMSICGITDPFCAAAWGAKFPDNRASKSMALPFRARTTLGVDSSGNGAILFAPGYTFNMANPSTVSATTAGFITFVAALVPSYAPTTVISGYRINSMGLRLKNVVTPMTASGIVRIRGFGAKTGGSLGSVDFSNYNYDFGEDIPLQDCHDTCIVFRKLDDTAEFITPPATTNPTTAVSDWASSGWGAVAILVTGATASLSSVLDIELYVNYELVFTDSDTNALIMTKARPANSFLTNASAAITNSINPIFERGVKAVEKTIADKAWSFVGRALGGVAGYALGGAQGAMAGVQGAGMLMDDIPMVD